MLLGIDIAFGVLEKGHTIPLQLASFNPPNRPHKHHGSPEALLSTILMRHLKPVQKEPHILCNLPW
jgi:hypothetical protein